MVLQNFCHCLTPKRSWGDWSPVIVPFALLLLFCGLKTNGAQAASTEPITKTATVPLIKLEYPGRPANIRMLYVRLLTLGQHAVNQPLLFDTGSAGMTVDCRIVLAENLCSDRGIKIKNELEIDGLKITTKKIVSNYGIYDEYGNLGFATVTFGSSSQSVTTSEKIPVLIRYKKVRQATGEIVGGPLWPLGMFGVSPMGGQAGGTLRSPIIAVAVGNDLHRGFFLSPIGAEWQQCTNEQGNCPTVDSLHIGIDEATRREFKISKLNRSNSNHNFPTTDVCVTFEGGSVCKPTLFDTGNSTIKVAHRSPNGKGESLLGNEEVTVSGADVGVWKFKTTYRPEVEFAPKRDTNNVGIRYFETNSLLIDYDAKEIGFAIGK